MDMTRFPNGVSTAEDGHVMLRNYPAPDPTKLAQFFTDFHTFVSGDWTITETEAGAGDASEALTDEANGVLLLTNDAADNDAISMQHGAESFLPVSGRDIFFEARFKISDATQSDFLIGLVVTDTTPLANANGIYFRKDDGDTALDFETNASSVASTETNIKTVSADTYIKVGFKVTGTSLVEYYVDDVKQGEFNTNIPVTELRPTIHIQNGEAAIKTASIDYILASQTSLR